MSLCNPERLAAVSRAEALAQYLRDNNGFCDQGGKSDADAIYRRSAVSKRVFKRAL